MALNSTLYIRVVTQDRDNGFMLLVGYDRVVVQRTALQYSTISTMTRQYLDATIQRVRDEYKTSTLVDVTAPAITKRLQKLFGEPVDGAKTK